MTGVYSQYVRPLLFRLNAEMVHEAALTIGGLFRLGPLKNALRKRYFFEDPRLAVTVAGLQFRNPIGLAAGFDKNCVAVDLLEALGFGHLELGTVTARPQPGNEKPRIFRYPNSAALINRMGFPSCGMRTFVRRLGQVRLQSKPQAILGVNIGKSKVTPIDEAPEDYRLLMVELGTLGDYYVINVSSPNTPELRKLQEPERLRSLLLSVRQVNKAKRPVFVKVAPDLSHADLESVLQVCLECGIAGIVATNTTFTRDGLQAVESEQGGMSGRPLHARACEMVAYIYRRTEGRLPIIGVGGVFSGADAYRMIQSGASLVQVYTGFVYEGPSLVRSIKEELLVALDRDGFNSIAEAVGTASAG